MGRKRGQTSETLLKMVVMLVLLAVLLFFVYQYILKNGQKLNTAGDCESKPPQTCVAKAETCKGQAFKFGCTGNPKGEYCCVPQT